MRDMINKPIVLVGMMGSGKSTVGKRLARKLNFQFYDSDKIIEERNGLSIVDIFEFRGEEYFRKQEIEVIREILGYGKVVISTGGDSFIFEEIRELIKKEAVSVWLSADIETLYARVSRRATRPQLLNNIDQREVLETMLKDRAEIYSTADISVQSGDNETHFIVDIILSKMKKICEDEA